MTGRTCILVTHNVALCVPGAKRVVVLDNGRVIMQGSPDTVVASGVLGNDELLKSGIRSKQHSQMPSRVPSYVGETPMNGKAQISSPAKPGTNGNEPAVKKKDKISGEETKAVGSVDWRVYYLYLRSMGPWWYWILVVITFLAQQIGSIGTAVWIREWALRYESTGSPELIISARNAPASSIGYSGSCFSSGSCVWPLSYNSLPESVTIADNTDDVNLVYYLGIYALIGFAYTLVSFFREAVVFYGSLVASKTIHNQLLYNIMRAKFRFFDSTPLGRIINRFSKDMEAVDQEVAPVALGMIHSLASVISIAFLISFITPGFLGPAAVIALLYWLIGSFYLRASRDLKRLESIQRSPLYQHFGETLSGISTIRAYGDERRFVRDNLSKIDNHHRPFFYLWACNRWLSFRVDIVGALVSFFAGAFVVLNAGKIDAGLAGLSLTYAVTFTDNVLWFVRLYAMNEQNMNSYVFQRLLYLAMLTVTFSGSSESANILRWTKKLLI